MTVDATHSEEEMNGMESDISEEAVKERRYLWMARTFALVCVVSFLATLILLSALFSLLPIVRVQPFYLSTMDKDQQIISIQRPNYAELDMNLLTESFIRQYLLSRLTVGTNIPELERRWGIDGSVNWMSESSVFQEFARTANLLLEQARKEGLTRNVKILVVSPYRSEGEGVNVWRAEIELTDMKQGDSQPTKSKWLVVMQVAFRPTRPGLTWDQRLKNPLGFTVLKFGIQALPS